MKWREIATYMLLYKIFGQGEIKYFELLSFLRLFYGKRNSRREIKRLLNIGLLERDNDKLRVLDLDYFIKVYVIPYFIRRLKNRIRSIDKKAEVIMEKDTLTIICYNQECATYIQSYGKELEYLPFRVFVKVNK